MSGIFNSLVGTIEQFKWGLTNHTVYINTINKHWIEFPGVAVY